MQQNMFFPDKINFYFDIFFNKIRERIEFLMITDIMGGFEIFDNAFFLLGFC